MPRLTVVLANLAALAALISVFSDAHRAIDTLALGLPFYGLLSLFGVIAAKRFLSKALLGAIGLGVLIWVGAHFIPQPAGGDLRIYTKNLLANNTEISALIADIESANVDVVFFQEVSETNDAILEKLINQFPHQHLCRFSGWSGIAILSKHPFAGEQKCSSWRALAAAPITISGQHVWLVSAHIPWPWPHDSASNEQAALALLKDLNGPIVIAGDFNAFPWTPRVGRMASLTNTILAGPTRPTLIYRHIPLPIDLILSPQGGRTERRPLLGSDHHGIVGDLAIFD